MSKRNQPLLLIIITLVVIAASWGLFGRSRNRRESGQNPAFTQEMLYQVRKGSLEKTIATEGFIQAIEEQTLTFPVKSDGSLKLSKIYIKKGDRVDEGTLLMVLDKTEATLRYTQKVNTYNRIKITGSQKEIEEARIDMELARDQLKNMELVAPFAGVITEVYVEEGDHYVSGEVATIKDISRLEVEVNIEEKNIPLIKLGQNARITLESLPGELLTGKVTEIATEVVNNNGLVTLPVTITLDQTDQEIKLGCSAQVDIVVGAVQDQIIIPITAVFTRENRDLVMKWIGNKLQPVPVETTLSDGLRIAVESGLEIGDEILVNTYLQGSQFPTQQEQSKPRMMMRMGPASGRGGR
ncbi:MAG TPA: efflux RND transporter periplasmic adaptor subunit [Firmicutes bacterium]|nr:efflux RND transporter periplasmic adaptor subunit [Bacillota bacterium]